MMHLRQRPGGFYARPECDERDRRGCGLRGAYRRLLWRLGFDPLTVRQRLAQTRREAEDWKRWGEEAADATYAAWGEDRSRVEWGDAIRTKIEEARRDRA